MAAILYTLINLKFGKDWQQQSDEEQAEAGERWTAFVDRWKKDPDIEFVCYYHQPDTEHNFLLKVGDADKYLEMRDSFWLSRFPIERVRFELVVGNSEWNDTWTP